MAIPTQEVQVPTQEQLQAQANQLIIRRSGLKDQIEQIEKQLPVITAMVQLLAAQAEAAKPEVKQD